MTRYLDQGRYSAVRWRIMTRYLDQGRYSAVRWTIMTVQKTVNLVGESRRQTAVWPTMPPG